MDPSAANDQTAAPKRFYKDVSIETTDAGFAVLLDGRPARTRKRAAFSMPTEALANAVADEWRRQSERIDFAAMPLSNLEMTVIDLGPDEAPKWRDLLIDYAGTDLLCYRADGPARLVERQNAAWDPFLAWASTTLGVSLRQTCGVMAIAQPDAAIAAARAFVDGLDAGEALAAKTIAEITGSAVLAFAALASGIEPARILGASRVDEEYQWAEWGRDAEAVARAEWLEKAFYDAVRFLALRRASPGDGEAGSATLR